MLCCNCLNFKVRVVTNKSQDDWMLAEILVNVAGLKNLNKYGWVTVYYCKQHKLSHSIYVRGKGNTILPNAQPAGDSCDLYDEVDCPELQTKTPPN